MKVRTNGIEIACYVEGAGPWVVMSHSLACASGMWDEQVKVLASRYKVLRFDTRGHGASDAPPGPYTLEMLADDVYGVLQKLGITHCHWVGLSMGGMIGQVFALKYPGVFRSMTLADTTSRYGPEARPMWEARIRAAMEKGMEPLVQPTLERWFTAPYRASHPEVMQRIGDMIRATPVAGYAGCCAAIPEINTTDRLASVTCPVLVIVGAEDMGTPVAMAKEIADALPNAELTVLPSAAHLSNIEQADLFNQRLLAFLERAS